MTQNEPPGTGNRKQHNSTETDTMAIASERKNNAASRKDRILRSANFRDGAFTNLSPTKMKPDDVSYLTMFRKALNRPKFAAPDHRLPTIKTDLKSLQSETPVIIWFGHSAYLVHCRGKNILVDPTFSGYASPFSFMVKAFPGSNSYTVEDLPEIDVLLITHDHYDHLDLPTLSKLTGKVKRVVTSLGVGGILENIFPDVPVIELDWWESTSAGDVQINACPARHFSGRSLRRNLSLWSSFAITTAGFSIYAGGDSGYDEFFKEIGNRFGPFDIAILECGQYNTMWPLIHMMPEETAQAGKDLQSKWLLPVHWSKFALALHEWNEPVRRLKLAAEALSLNVTTPKIGEPVILNESYPQQAWWL
jgi:L-ascorbate metabolism protein UlaG (beta-lactamase superfamily)